MSCFLIAPLPLLPNRLIYIEIGGVRISIGVPFYNEVVKERESLSCNLSIGATFVFWERKRFRATISLLLITMDVSWNWDIRSKVA